MLTGGRPVKGRRICNSSRTTTSPDEAAVTYDAQKNAFVDVAAPGTKTGRKKAPVKVGVSNGTKIQILDGLKAGDKIVLPS